MADAYYKPCKEFDICNELIEKYWESKQYDKCFEGHLVLAEQGYPLAECQIGYFYYEGLGVEKDLEKALYWTRRAAEHGDRDGQYNLAEFYEDAIGWNEISNRLSIGIDLLHCKTMIWQSRNAKNLELHCNYASQYNQQFVNFKFSSCPLREEKSFSQRAFFYLYVYSQTTR